MPSNKTVRRVQNRVWNIRTRYVRRVVRTARALEEMGLNPREARNLAKLFTPLTGPTAKALETVGLKHSRKEKQRQRKEERKGGHLIPPPTKRQHYNPHRVQKEYRE